MNDSERIKIYTRSMNRVLYHKSMALCTLHYRKERLVGTTADGYLMQVIGDTEADWVINIDEDAFVSDIDALKRLLAYCRENGYLNCGMPDGGVVHLRDGNPLVTNPYFNIFCTKSLREEIKHLDLGEKPQEECFTQRDLLVDDHNFQNTGEEPYYPMLIWMGNHCKTLYLNAFTHPDGESTVLCNHLGEPFLIHTWYSRFYNNDRFHTRRINQAFKEACTKQGVNYRSPLGDTMESLVARSRNALMKCLVATKKALIKK